MVANAADLASAPRTLPEDRRARALIDRIGADQPSSGGGFAGAAQRLVLEQRIAAMDAENHVRAALPPQARLLPTGFAYAGMSTCALICW